MNSRVMTLYPGDIIMTGTPAGVGANKKPQQFLYPGDVVYSWIDNVCSMYTFVQKFSPNKEPDRLCKPCITLTWHAKILFVFNSRQVTSENYGKGQKSIFRPCRKSNSLETLVLPVIFLIIIILYVFIFLMYYLWCPWY